MPKNRLPSYGDVIISKRFQFGRLGFDGKPPIEVGQKDAKYMIGRRLTDEEITEEVLRTKKMPNPLWRDFDLGVPDPSRGTAKFLVTESNMQGGGGRDDYPDGWHIVAKRLDEKGKFDPKGEEIAFYMTGCFIDMIPPEEVSIVGHLAMTITYSY